MRHGGLVVVCCLTLFVHDTSAQQVADVQPGDRAADASAKTPTLTGVAYVGATDLDTRGAVDSELGMGIELSGRVKGSTQINAVYVRGWNPGISPVLRYGMHRARGHFRVRAPGFTFEAGEIRPETPLTAIRVPTDGVSFQKTGGRVIAAATAGIPKHFAGGWGGHLFQGAAGLSFPRGAVSLFASQLARPLRSSRIIGNALPVDEDSELVVEDLRRVGELLSRENLARTFGLETRLSLGNHHLVTRGGWVELVNTAGDRISSAAATGTYAVNAKRASFNTLFRTMPRALPGLSLSGDLWTMGGKLNLWPSIALVGRSYWNETWLFGRTSVTRARGLGAGIEYSKNHARAHLQANYRDSHFTSTTITRSVSAGLRLPFGSWAGVDSAVEYGEADYGQRRRRIAAYRASIYAEGETASLMVSGSHSESGVLSPRLSLDVGGTLSWGRTTIEGGGGVSRAGIFGDVAHGWATVAFPLPRELTLMLGVDYDRWSFARSPYLVFVTAADALTPPWRFTFNVERKLRIPVPFLK